MRKHVFAVFITILLMNQLACLSRAAVTYDRINVTNVPGFLGAQAVPNDNTSDKAAIDAALNYVYPTPTPGYTPTKSIYFPAGTYIYDGRMDLPINKSFRLYGDGPGVSTIIFKGVSGNGINALNVGDKMLQVDGLTIQAGSANCLLANAIFADFNANCDPGCGAILAPTVTIRNVEIRGSDRSNVPANYWGNGISLKRAQNAVVEDIHISGHWNFTGDGPLPNYGINWFSGTNTFANTFLVLHNIYVKYYKTGIAANGYVESLRLSQFELFWCGYRTPARAAIEVNVNNGITGYRGGVYHISDGHINQIATAIRMYTANDINISHVDFSNQEYNGTNLELHDCSQVTLVDNDFHDQLHDQTLSNGIYVFSSYPGASSNILMSGNSFRSMAQSAGGSCIVLEPNCRYVKILDTLFDTAVLSHYNNGVPPFPNPGATYIRDFPY